MFDVYKTTLSKYDENGFIGVQLELDGGDGPLAELHHPFGFSSRPLDPDDDGDCSAYGFQTGDEYHALLGYDRRIIPKIPQLPKGSSCQYSATGSYHMIQGDTGTATIYVPYANNTKTLTIQCNAETEAISIIQGDGSAVIVSSDGVTIRSPDGSTWYEQKNGSHVFSGDVTFTGSLTTSQAVLPMDSLVKMTQLVTYLTELETKLGAVGVVPAQPASGLFLPGLGATLNFKAG